MIGRFFVFLCRKKINRIFKCKRMFRSGTWRNRICVPNFDIVMTVTTVFYLSVLKEGEILWCLCFLIDFDTFLWPLLISWHFVKIKCPQFKMTYYQIYLSFHIKKLMMNSLNYQWAKISILIMRCKYYINLTYRKDLQHLVECG